MRKFLLVAFTASIIAACQPSAPSDPNQVVRQWLDSNGKQSIKVTKVVTGNPKNYKADELWCVETDSKTPDGITYLLMTYRTGSTWATREMTDGEYEWDLNSCPRD
jgi:hypothetical protein